MAKVDITIEVCGTSGDGTIAAGGILNQAMSLAGYSVLAFDTYPAEIRGFGRCVTRSRFGDEPQVALTDVTDLLISLDDEQSLSRLPMLSPEAVVVFESNPPVQVSEDKSLIAQLPPSHPIYGVPFRDLAAAATGNIRGRNLVCLGALAALLKLPSEPFHQTITKKFQSKGDKVVEANIKSFEAGVEYAAREFAKRLPTELPKVPPADEPRFLISGNVAIAEGALAAGVKNYFGYPITPATPIMEYLAAKLPGVGGTLIQMEDEIASIGAVLGGFFAGVRSMTATSGPGFALMTELIAHGVMSETPAVIVNAQRGGPSTGLPTKTEQSDLHAAVWGGPGDSPRIVIAPTNVMECYHYTAKSFQLAEKYQTPVIVLTDFFLDNRVENLVTPQADPMDIADGTVYPAEEDKGAYQRYRLTNSGISPRAVPGMESCMYAATGLEHTETGAPDFSPPVHQAMSDKRKRKLQGALADLWPPEAFGDKGELDVGVISWGSNFGSVLEAVCKVKAETKRAVGALKVTSMSPLHKSELREFLDRTKIVLVPELNAEGQLANLIGHLVHQEIIKLNQATGTPMPPSVIKNKILEILGEAAK
jgi:2-oxoglutarate ferredoxin oxidoreductase subunit alpha